jgi:predicted Mrr-cat superfamily restriction endonuclease
MSERYPTAKLKTVLNWVSQVWPFAHEMRKSDMVVVPLKSQPAIYMGEIAGDYQFEAKGPNPYYHWRSARCIGEAVPRASFGQARRLSPSIAAAAASYTTERSCRHRCLILVAWFQRRCRLRLSFTFG